MNKIRTDKVKIKAMHYYGEINEKGEAFGKGYLSAAGFESFTGTFKDNKRNGFGVETHRYGFTFVGEWKNNLRWGKMTYTSPHDNKIAGY